MRMKCSLSIIAGVLIASCAGKETVIQEKLEAVPFVDISKYVGTWHEIARYPNSFQKGCTKTTATYSLRDDGKISVVNRCRIDGPEGKEKSASGKAWVVDPSTNAKLKVQFFWPFRGDYWVIQLDKDYRYAVVGEPGRRYLWILARDPHMDNATYDAICSRLRQQGYDPARLIKAG